VNLKYLLLLSLFSLACTPTADADQTWPARPVKAIVPIGPGSMTDIVPRVVFEQLSAQLGQPIIIENRPGAGQTTGARIVARAERDGYTLLVNSSAQAIAPSLYSNLGYDPARDFISVIPLGVAPHILVVPADRGFKTARDFADAAKAKPGAFNFGSSGIGTATHLSAERFKRSAGIDAVHIAFKGGAETIAELIAGRLDFFFGPLGVVLPHIRAGKLTALAMNGGKRSPLLPDVPTTLEAGFADAEYPLWFGVFVPAHTPPAIVNRLHSETAKALEAPKVREKLTVLGVEPLTMTQAEFTAYVETEISVNASLVKAAGLKPE
jgi:tripartite-type tricarboxylate transporter receptor subunit TctC